jgi:hypothetical protein
VAEVGTGEAGRRLERVVFACRHVFHRGCLDSGYLEGKGKGAGEPGQGRVYRCPVCT